MFFQNSPQPLPRLHRCNTTNCSRVLAKERWQTLEKLWKKQYLNEHPVVYIIQCYICDNMYIHIQSMHGKYAIKTLQTKVWNFIQWILAYFLLLHKWTERSNGFTRFVVLYHIHALACKIRLSILKRNNFFATEKALLSLALWR